MAEPSFLIPRDKLREYLVRWNMHKDRIRRPGWRQEACHDAGPDPEADTQPPSVKASEVRKSAKKGKKSKSKQKGQGKIQEQDGGKEVKVECKQEVTLHRSW